MLKKYYFAFVVIVWSGLVQADTITVGPGGPGGGYDHATIQAGINAAVNGDEVIVADGNYSGLGNKNIDFGGRAITVQSENGPELTVIDCEDDGRGFDFHSGEGPNSVLEGFTIADGNTSGFAGDNRGGGIKCIGSSPTINKCIFRDNQASKGGGMYNNDSRPALIDCVFTGNLSESDGGGMYNTNDSNAILINCVFSGNRSTDWTGGGMRNDNSNPILTSCVFSGNSAGEDGGGMENQANSKPTLRNCLFIGNSAAVEGGGMVNAGNCNPTMINCTFSGNTAVVGGGIYDYDTAQPTLTNCILWGNSDSNGSGESAQIHVGSGTSVVNYSCIQGGWSGGGIYNIDSDPCFVDSNSGDYHLRWDSLCVNAGDPNFVFDVNEREIDGEPRVMAGRIDIGADEVGEKQADFTRDGTIDGKDLGMFVRAWLSSPVEDDWYILCDLYEDDQIDFVDYSKLASDWLWQASWYEP